MPNTTSKTYVTINGTQFKAFSTYNPVQNEITKGGRNNLTGLNKLRLIAKKWKLTLTAPYISDADYDALLDSITDSLHTTVCFYDKGNTLITMDAYVVITKGRTLESDAMGCWSDFSIELIEN